VLIKEKLKKKDRKMERKEMILIKMGIIMKIMEIMKTAWSINLDLKSIMNLINPESI
jgi:hypothetical protein